MKRFDKIIFGIIMGSAFPLLFTMSIFLIWFYTSRNESIVLYYIYTGLVLGLLIDSLILKKLITKLYTLPNWVLVVFYMFFSICIYGFFMGFPVFILLMGILAGYYYGNRMRVQKTTGLNKTASMIIKISAFTAMVIFLFCMITSILVLHEETIGDELENMLHAGFDITKTMVILSVIFGTVILVIAQYYLTRIVMIKTLATKTTIH